MIAERVKRHVEERGVKQAAIANAIGISRQSMCLMLAGKRVMSAEEYVKICDFLQVPYDKFITGD